MEDTKSINDSFDEVIIYKPKPVKLCPSSKKSLKSSLSSSISTINSEIAFSQFNVEETKIYLENVSIEEINTDFLLYSQYLEEEEVHNELFDILSNPLNNKKDETNNMKKDFPKIKRCENPPEKIFEMIKVSYFDELMEDFNELCNKENKEEKEKKKEKNSASQN